MQTVHVQHTRRLCAHATDEPTRQSARVIDEVVRHAVLFDRLVRMQILDEKARDT